MTWLDPARRHGKLSSRGRVAGSAGERSVVAPATGDELGRADADPRAVPVLAGRQSDIF